MTEPENDFGEFGEQRLIELVRDNRELPLPQISEIVTMAVDNWIGDNEQPDDVTLVLGSRAISSAGVRRCRVGVPARTASDTNYSIFL